MCTVVIHRNNSNIYPVLVGQVRDEIVSRPWLSPNRHWADKPHILAGLDLISYGSWLGLNNNGLFCCLVNGIGTCTQNYTTGISRGHLVVDTLQYNNAQMAKSFLSENNKLSIQKDFFLIVATVDEAFCCINEKGNISFCDIPLGTSMITNYGLNNPDCIRTNKFLIPLSKVMTKIKPELNQWVSLIKLLQIKSEPNDIRTGIHIPLNNNGFGSLSSSLIALHRDPKKNIFKFCNKITDETKYLDIKF
jgi:uncharacterized protein with NRDE domain